MFKKENLIALVNAYQDKPEILSAITSYMNNLVDYVAFVASMEIQIPALRARLEMVDFQDEVMRLDRGCYNRQEGAISGLSILCRMAKMANVTPIYDGSLDGDDPAARNQIGDFCKEVVNVMFDGRTTRGNTMQDWLDAAKKEG